MGITIDNPATTTTGPPPVRQRLSSPVDMDQEVVAYGSPSDAGEGGQRAVEDHAEALRILRDS